MEAKRSIILDAGHGGAEPGAVSGSRREKDDNLRLALAVGHILSRNGLNVSYTRVTDIYQSPTEKAQIANASGADYFLSIHRNASANPGSASGVLSLVYEDSGIPAALARNINREVAAAGLTDLGVSERPGIIVLRKTSMPAVLVEAGFIDNADDNAFFDANFDRIAQAIADGVLDTIREEEAGPLYYQVQVAAYRDPDTAGRLLSQLTRQGFPAFTVVSDGLYKVRVGAFLNLDNAAHMEQLLRSYGYPTWIVHEAAVH